MSNKRLLQLLANRGGEIQHADFLDCYNQAIIRGVSGTILTGINFRCMHYVAVIEDSPSNKEGVY
jgi:hypothetical protein